MDKETLIRYLEDVVELEKQVFLQKQTLDALDSKIRSLGIKKEFYMPETLSYSVKKIDSEESKGNRWVIISILAFVLSFGSCFIVYTGENATFGSFLGVPILVLILSLIVGGVVNGIIGDIRDKRYSQTEYNREMADYDRRMAEYRRNVYDDAQRVNRELAEKRIIEQERSALYQKHLQTKQVLQSYYDLDIIYGKYRNFVAVSSFVDYFKSGRCSTLAENTGGDGAYNTFETEVRLDRIIDKLDVVISMLSQIKSNQWSIYNAIQEGNRISSRLVSATESLAESNVQIALSSAQTAHYAGITAANSAIAAYNSQQAANEAEQLRKLKQYELGIRSRRY